MTVVTGRRRLTLVRHGHAENKGPGHRDFERALDCRGVAEVNEMARRCLDLGLVPDLVLVSPALRTVQTAGTFQRMLERAPRQLQLEPSLYLAAADTLLGRIRETADDVGHLMVVAHNPGLSDLAEQLAPAAHVGGLETGAICSMQLVAADWGAVRPGQAQDLRYDAPGRFFDPGS